MWKTRRWQLHRKYILALVGIGLIAGVYWLLQRFFSPITSVGISLGIVGALLLLLAIIGGYRYNWQWTGVGEYSYPKTEGQEFHHKKTLWDWMQLLIIPAVLAGAALLFNVQVARTQQAIADDNQGEATLQSYLDSMSELLLSERLNTQSDNVEVRNVARVRTLSTLRRLDPNRKAFLMQFLLESQLITSTATIPPVISLKGADLSHADLIEMDLTGADLRHADLIQVDLTRANLTDVNLAGADMRGVWLFEANLRGAHLLEATVTQEQLAICDTLEGATLDDGTVVPEGQDFPPGWK